MPVPRPAIRLVRLGGQVRLGNPWHGIDHTEAMSRWSEAKARELANSTCRATSSRRTVVSGAGQLVARAKRLPRAEVESRYGETYMNSLRVLASKGKNVNVLTHMARYFKDYLEPHPKELMLRNHV